MSKTLKPRIVVITASLTLVVALVSAQQPKPAKPQTNPNQPSPATSVVNGNTEVSLSCGEPEFPPDWKKQLTFTERPTTICVRWSGKSRRFGDNGNSTK